MATRTILINGRGFGIESDDDYLLGMPEAFEPETIRLFGALVRPSDAVVDIGANLGLTALGLAQLGRDVLAIEASPSTYELLERNVARSGLDNVTPINVALGDREGELEIAFAPGFRAGGFISTVAKTGAGMTVEPVRLARLDDVLESLGRPRADVLKIDVEGFERFVLEGAPRTLAESAPVVTMELNHWCLNVFQRTSVPDFFDFLRATFPIVYAVEGDHFLDIRDPSAEGYVLHEHIVRLRFGTLVCAFDDSRLAGFRAAYTEGFPPPPHDAAAQLEELRHSRRLLVRRIFAEGRERRALRRQERARAKERQPTAD